ncbi:MAG: hypothetical protein ACR2GD_05890 [Pyrinomonadaceae bacterium]
MENSENVLFENAEKIEKILQFAVRQAVILHKQAGNPIAVWKDGKAVLIAPDEIEFDTI